MKLLKDKEVLIFKSKNSQKNKYKCNNKVELRNKWNLIEEDLVSN